MVLLERLREVGYDGGISILKDYVPPFRPPKKLPAVRRYETAPGKQAQMDWGIYHYTDIGGEVHKVPVFVMVLGHSRSKYIEFTGRCDLASLERCMVNAFVHFGGVPEKVLTDNMKTVVIGRDNGKPIWNTAFEDFSADMGFVPKVCASRRPQAKGKVERLIYSNIAMLQGFEAYIKANPDLDEDGAYRYLKYLLSDDLTYIRNIGVIQDSIILRDYPKDANTEAIGVDLSKADAQRNLVLKVKAELRPVFQGPIDLIQGELRFLPLYLYINI